jgi:hypothetical protein
MSNTSTQFKKGNKLSKGRPKGSKNRSSEAIREIILQVFDNNLDTLQYDLDAMNPFMRRKTLSDLTKYFLPALSKNDNVNEHKGAMEIIVKYQSQKDNKPAVADENNVNE